MTGICHEDRMTAINRIKDTVNKYGYITDYKFFSDISVSLVIEINEDRIKSIYDELSRIMDISYQDEFLPDSTTECLLLVNITFVKETGNLKIEVPAVPG